jgi:hypothetical protein
VRGAHDREPAPRREVFPRGGEHVFHRARHFVPGDLLPEVRVPPPFADFPVRGVGNHEVDGPRSESRNVIPEIAQDCGEPTLEPVFSDIPAGKLPQMPLDFDSHTFFQDVAPPGQEKENDARSGAQIQDRPAAVRRREIGEQDGVDGKPVPFLGLVDPEGKGHPLPIPATFHLPARSGSEAPSGSSDKRRWFSAEGHGRRGTRPGTPRR